jgi:nitrite reductase/ring-hydroxylating ferredoxin subunit
MAEPRTEVSDKTSVTEENLRSLHPSALRDRIPVLGLREYWYPAIEARKVPRGKPVELPMLGERVTFFRRRDGGVAAVSSICPHRGGSLGHGRCHFVGTVTCPYHGWTFNEDGACVAVLGEGPESRIPGMPGAKVRTYPTVTLKGVVFVWMGGPEVADPHEDIPPQLFDDSYLVQTSTTVWDCNWRPAFENLLDSHVFYVHRNAVHLMMLDLKSVMLMSKMGPRRPRPQVVNARGLMYPPGALKFIAAFAGKPDEGAGPGAETWVSESVNSFRDAYPGLGGAHWPTSSRRLIWHRAYGELRKLKPTPSAPPIEVDPEWKDAHLPSTYQVGYPDHIYSRITIPIDEKTSRIFYFHATKPTSAKREMWDRVYFKLFQNWMMNYNFSGQDARVVVNQAYDSPEIFSATDIFPLTLRRLILENARDFQRKTNSDVAVDGSNGKGEPGV